MGLGDTRMDGQPPQKPRANRNISRGTAPTKGPASSTAPRIGGGVISLQRLIWTCAFAAVTAVGAIYGAGLKTQQEYKAEKKQVMELSVEDKIEALERRRSTLLSQKRPLEEKLSGLRVRMKENELDNDRIGKNGEREV